MPESGTLTHKYHISRYFRIGHSNVLPGGKKLQKMKNINSPRQDRPSTAQFNYLWKARRDFKYWVGHHLDVTSVLLIGRPKHDKWHLTKTIGSLGFYISWFQFGPWLCLAVVWQNKRDFLVAVISNWELCTAVRQIEHLRKKNAI